MAGVHSYDVTLRDEKYSLRQGRGPSYLEIWRRSAKEPPVKEGKPLNMSTKRRNAQKGKNNAHVNNHTPTSTAVKTNPLFIKPLPQQHHTMEVSEPSRQSGTLDLTLQQRPTFYGQQTNIRITKDREMIAAIMDLATYGEKEMGPKKQKQSRTSLLMKAKMLRKGKTKQQHKGGAFFLRAPPLRTRNRAEVL